MDRWRLVGRVEEQAYVTAAIADRTRCGVLVAGTAGVGKTRLMREVIEAMPDCRVELVTATESARTLPFGAVAHLLPDDLASIDRVDLLAVIGRHLVHRAEGRPLVVAVDDIHLLDNLSAALVHHLATTRIGSVLLTLRSGEAAPDAVTALHRDDLLSRLELQPISRAEFGELLEGVLGGMVEQVALDRMWAVTEGNVLFARELVGDAVDAGTLRLHHGVWRWSGGLGIAPRLRETVAGRLGALDPAQRHFLELLAVGEPLPLSRAVALAPTVSLPGLERRGLVTTEPADHGPRVRLAHPLFGEALRTTMPLSLHRQLSQELAQSLASAEGERAGEAIKLALLREAAGEEVKPALLAEAARNANALSDGKLAERLARASVAAADTFDARFELGHALLIQNRFEESSTVLRALVGEEANDDDRERLADALALAVFHGLGRVDEALDVVKRIEDDVTDPAIVALLQCHRATLLAFGARFAEAAQLGANALNSVNDDTTRVRSLTSVGVSLVMAGRIDEALALNEGTLEAAFRLRDRLPRAPGWAIGSRCTALFFAGRSDEALGLLDLGDGAAHLSASMVAQATTNRARYLLSQGRARTAGRLLNDVLLTLRENPVREPSWGLALAAEAHALLGQHNEARTAAAESVSLRRDDLVAFEVDEWRALAWVDAQDGRTTSAIAQLWAAADLAATRGQRSFELIILHDLLRLGEHRAARRAGQVAEQVDGAWSAAIAVHASALLAANTSVLESAARAFEAISSFMVAAELWAAVANNRQSEGLRAKASQATRSSVEMAARCEGARTRPLGRAADPVPLTRRERETVTLAAQGGTNAQIAAELSVSIRTVETHLYHAFAKLGVADRSQLSDRLPA
jgi:DNA-binding CsgD family transcriptional regulator/tetratricopeptide (TPR) repeat protein